MTSLTIFWAIFFVSLGLALPRRARAHTFWTTALPAKEGEKATVVLGYGDSFPEAGPIEEDRVRIFFPPELISPAGKKIPLSPTSENHLFVSDEPLGKGTHLVTGVYKPTIWVKTVEKGWEIKSKKDATGTLLLSGRYSMFAKGVYGVAGNGDDGLASEPAGQPLELVPLSNPLKLKPGDLLKVRLLWEGKPLPRKTVFGITEGYGDPAWDLKAYAGSTDNDGILNFVPWKSGRWQLEADHSRPSADPGECDAEVAETKLNFLVG
ncbi:MAG: DUF4198 domain-containing protein [Deltaproteobacteria bacterium]|jgi:uncharacterized GH25 family protein|nr:DUF4198 domain-containing protein [Deltaproteobacteria bacterium]